MPKRSKRPVSPPEPQRPVTFQVRLDHDLHARLKAESENAGVSMNQLIQGILRGCLDVLVQGEAVKSPGGVVSVNPVKGCLFFGRPATPPHPGELERFEEGLTDQLLSGSPGVVWFGLDFTNRGVVRYQ